MTPPPPTSPIEWETQHNGLPTSATSRTQGQVRGKTQLDGGGGRVPKSDLQETDARRPKKPRKVAQGKQLHHPGGSALTTSDPGVACSAQRTHNHEKKGADQKAW